MKKTGILLALFAMILMSFTPFCCQKEYTPPSRPTENVVLSWSQLNDLSVKFVGDSTHVSYVFSSSTGDTTVTLPSDETYTITFIYSPSGTPQSGCTFFLQDLHGNEWTVQGFQAGQDPQSGLTLDTEYDASIQCR